MSQKPETVFRNGQVRPFLKTLKNTAFFPIQQLAIIGDPDFMLCCFGIFVALELKASGGKTRPIQQRKLDEVTRCHGISIVATPENWNEVKNKLTHLDRGVII